MLTYIHTSGKGRAIQKLQNTAEFFQDLSPLGKYT